MGPKSHRVIAAAVLASALGIAASAAAVTVHIDQNTLVELRAPAGNVVIGNPSIADVSLLSPRRVAILGRSYGLTNLIVTDRMGHTIWSEVVNVAPAETGRVSLYRGAVVNNFACSPRCERTAMPGEPKPDFETFSGPYKDYEDRAKADAAGGAGGP